MDRTSMPPPPPRRPRDAGDLRKQALGGLLAAAGPTAPSSTHASEPLEADLNSGQAGDQIDQNAWKQYWDERKEVELPHRGGMFNVYTAGHSGPVLFAVHGAGYTGLTWSLIAGALKSKYRIIAPDLRGHGLTRAQPETDFSMETMSEDLVAIWDALFESETQTQSSDAKTPKGTVLADSNTTGTPSNVQKQEGDPRATVIVGHSMGGAMAVWAAASRKLPHVKGCVVVDVVEGTAIAALPHMGSVIAARPTTFPSPAAAVSWALRSGMSRCKEAASISIPAQLACGTDSSGGSCKHSDVKGNSAQSLPGTQLGQTSSSILDTLQHTHPGHSILGPGASIQEEEEEEVEEEETEQQGVTDSATATQESTTTTTGLEGSDQQAGHQNIQMENEPHQTGQRSQSHAPTGSPCSVWHWRTSLKATQPYWEGWYQGLSDAFLGLPMPKMLLLAGTDRLDKQLTIGQMQGKFQLVLLPAAGHAIQEDDCLATSNALDMFTQRQRIGQPPLAIPRAPIGTKPVLPIVAGPVL